MIKTKALPVILRVISKLDAKPIIERLKKVDFKSLDDGKGQLSREDAVLLGFELLGEVLPQLGKIESDIVPFIAAVKDISIEDAGELDFIQVLKEIFTDKELTGFFKSALMKKAED